jgi:hypothetical protein
MDFAHTSSPEPPHSPPFESTLSRQDTASSAGSNEYRPMLPGHWLLNFHGSCPRCHHQHNAVNIRVDVSRDPRKVSKVTCERCQQNWLAFGGRNSTRISLLSTTTTNPDVVESEVRNALISMVKSATAIASPILTDIPETPFNDRANEYAGPSRVNSVLRPVPATSMPISGRVSFHVPATRNSQDAYTTISTSRTKPQFSIFRRSSLRRMFGFTKEQMVSAKAMGKRPVEEFGTSANSPFVHSPIQAQTDHELKASGRYETPLTRPTARSEETSNFVAGLKNESLDTMDKMELVHWMRGKITEFKSHRVASPSSTNSPTVDTRSRTTQTELPPIPPTRLAHRSSIDLLGLGSHLGHFDRVWDWASDITHRSRSISISERTSEAITIVNEDTTFPSGIRNSWHEFVNRERRGSGSPRPPSMHRARRSLQQLRQPPAEARHALESTVFSGAMVSPPAARGGVNVRWSRGSRASMTGFSGIISRTSLHLPLNEDDTDYGSQNSPPLSSPTVRND